MPTFATPKPINVEISLMLGNVTITAEERADTVVTISPTDPENASDVNAAAETHADFSGDTVTVKGQKMRKYIGPTKNSMSVDVDIAVPTGSSVSAKGYGAMVSLTATGRLDKCEFRSGGGRLAVDRAGQLKLRTDGDIVVDRADGDVNASTSTGNIRIGEVREGAVELKTSMGEIEVGIPQGTAALLDVQTSFGAIRNQLADIDRPEPGESTVTIRARTSGGNIEIRRT